MRQIIRVLSCGHFCDSGVCFCTAGQCQCQCCVCGKFTPKYMACAVCKERLETPPMGTHKLTPKTDRHLLLDLDTEAQVQQFVENLNAVGSRFGGIRGLRIWPSKSKGTHAEVELWRAPQNHHETCFIQMFLGSDPIREWLNYGTDQHNLLFEPDVFGERVK